MSIVFYLYKPFILLDWEGEWGWQNLTSEKWQLIVEKLRNFESMTWGQIESGDQNDGSHEVMLKDYSNKAVLKRLEQLQLFVNNSIVNSIHNCEFKITRPGRF